MSTGISFGNIKRIIKPKYIVKGFSVENLKRGFTYIPSSAQVSNIDYKSVFDTVSSYEANAGFGIWDRYVSFSDKLVSGEVLVGTPEVTTTASNMLISDIFINSSVITNGYIIVSIGHAVKFKIGSTVEQEVDASIIVSCNTSNNNRKSIEVCQPIKKVV